MKMEDCTLLSIQDLLQHSCPVTGALSLHLSSSSISISSLSSTHITDKKRKRSHKPCSANVNERHGKTLKPINHPTLISGTIQLWNGDSLAFADHTNTRTVCCVAFDLDPHVIGRQINILSWNFIPHTIGSGCLEIYKWRLATVNAPLEIRTDTQRGRLRSGCTTVCGRLCAISPPFYLPCVKPCKESFNENESVPNSDGIIGGKPSKEKCNQDETALNCNDGVIRRKTNKESCNQDETAPNNTESIIGGKFNKENCSQDQTVPNNSDDIIGGKLNKEKCNQDGSVLNNFDSTIGGNGCPIGPNIKHDGLDIDIVKGLRGKIRASSSSSNPTTSEMTKGLFSKYGHTHIRNESLINESNRSQSVKKQRIHRVGDINKGGNADLFDKNSRNLHKNAKLTLSEEENTTVVVKGKETRLSNLHTKEESVGNNSKDNAAGGAELGFVIELQACNHKPQCKMSSEVLFGIAEKNHTSVEPAFVYFTGSIAAWRPVLSGLFGKCLNVTGLKRKVIFIGSEKEKYNIFVATRTTLLSLLSSKKINNHSVTEHYDMSESYTYSTKGAVPIWMAAGLSKTPSDLDNCKSIMSSNVDMRRCSENCASDLPSGIEIPGLLIGKVNEQGQGQGSTGSYVGVVISIHMQGSLVELDKNVWLLLSHQPLTQVQGLRIGVLLALMHVHFIKIQFACEKILLLGACFRSHVVVKSFSPLRTMFNIRPHSWSLLSRYIESLPFTAAFWVLLIAICFRRKFQGFFSEKEILGSKKREGMVQKYVQCWCSPFNLHRDVMKEFFNHNSCPIGKRSRTIFQLVTPIINFCRQIEVMWDNRFSIIWTNKKHDFKEVSILQCKAEGSSVKKDVDCRRFARRIISSGELGVVLIGILQVSHQSGHLQLVDATGALDVVVPDFVSCSSLQKFYEVTKFNVVVEGFWGHFCSQDTDDDLQPISCARIIDGLVSKHKLSSVTYYVHFYLEKAVNFSLPRCPALFFHNPVHIKMQEIQHGRVFSILMVTHKYPITDKLVLDESDHSAVGSFAEAILLPYSIVSKGGKHRCYNKSNLKHGANDKSGHEIFTTVGCTICCFETMKTRGAKTGKEHVVDFGSYANANVDCTKCNTGTAFKSDDHGIQNHLSDYLYNEQKVYEEMYSSKEIQSETLQEIQCSLLFRNSCKDDVLLDGILSPPVKYQDPKKLAKEDHCLKKVLLEFNSESLHFYEVLHIGECYLIQHEVEDSASGSGIPQTCVKTNKIVVSSDKPIWSLSVASYHQITQQICHQAHFSSSLEGYTTPSLLSQLSNDDKSASIDNVENGMSSIVLDCQAPSLCFRDVTLYIPCQVIHLLQKFIEHVKGDMLSVVMDAYDVFNKYLIHRGMPGPTEQFFKTSEFDNSSNNEGALLDGDLVSLKGEVKHVHSNELNPFANLNKFGSRCLSTGNNLTSIRKVRYTIHVQGFHGDQKIQLSGIIGRGVLPLGFGPGVIASFYRLLLQRDLLGEQELLVTAASFIVVNGIKEFEYHANGGHNIEIVNPLPSPNNWNAKELTFISCLSQNMSAECFRLCCRVVAIESLVLEWEPAKYESACPSIASSTDILNSIQIISGRFILGLCDCWASGARAAYLLRLHSTAAELFKNAAPQCNISKRVLKKHKNSVGSLVEKLVKKHRRVTIQKTRTVIPSNSDFVILGASGEILNLEDQRLISFVLQKACNSAPLVIIGSILDSISQQTQELKKRDEIEIKTNQENFSTLTQYQIKILARDVFSISYLQEAGNCFELLKSEI
ncbi:CST complex subunit CTC1 isoform X2 [Cryptomeria japonica]|uniref:CST complex subunit CTC1 isoform X2 n=1 Tax=Cryptomeria japonica TaxID=3369 RepID=UPI0027D9F419|nr:CST complex subunit CTC1 isoform X2 [Cryptomeria japonica]